MDVTASVVTESTTEATESAEIPSTEQTEQTAQPVEDRFSSRFSSLAKREREITKKASELKEVESKLKEWESAKGSAKQNIEAFLQTHDLSYDDILNHYLEPKAPVDPQVKSLQDRLDAIENEKLEAAAQQAKAQHEEVMQSFKGEITACVKEKGFELIEANEAHDLVLETIEQYFEENRKLLSVEEGCQLVEEYLEGIALKQLNTAKMKNKFSSQPKQETPVKSNKDQTKTLTNNLTATSSTPSPLKTEKDRMQAAKSILKWQ